MDGEIDGAEETGQERQGQQVDQAAGDDLQRQQEAQVGAAPTDGEIRAALAEASKTVESAEALARQIEELKASADEERVGFELRLADARSATAARALLGGSRPPRRARRRRGQAQGGRALAVFGPRPAGRRHGA